MANNFRKGFDRQAWAPVKPAPNAHGAGMSLSSDLRSDVSRNPFVYQLVSNTVLNRYNVITKGWGLVLSPALAGTFAAGASSAFVPSLGLVGTIAAGATATSVILSTALPTAVGVNMLANRGGSGDYGFKLRIIDTVAGKTAERFIVWNSGGTTPEIGVLSSFGFTPSSGARYEIIAGRLFMLGAGAVAANIWRSFEVATNTLSTGLSTTNLPSTIATDTDILVLDEQYTPWDHNPGDGMVKGAYLYDAGLSSRYALTATAAAGSSITGQATLGDAVVRVNEYRNFQIRIVEDTTTPAAVGQRRIIASHTAGPSAVYTLGTAWATTPSASAKFVIELPNLMLVRSSATTTVYTYNYGDAAVNNGTNSIAAGAWSTTYFGAAPAGAAAGGMWMPSFGMQPDEGRQARHSFNYFWRGGGVNTLDVLDIAGAITGAWTAGIVYDGAIAGLPNAGSCGGYCPFDNEGRMFYINLYATSAINQVYRFDVRNRVLSPFTPPDIIQAGTATSGKRIACYSAQFDSRNWDAVLMLNHLATVPVEITALV
jgi:hypothetical protein